MSHYKKQLVNGCKSGNLEMVRSALESSLNVNEPLDAQGSTALIIAIEHNHSNIADFLIEEGADIDRERSDGFTPLMAAAIDGRTDIVGLLLSEDVDIGAMTNMNYEAGEGWTALMLASQEGHSDTVGMLLFDMGDDALAEQKIDDAYDIAVAAGHPDVASLIRDHMNTDIIEEARKGSVETLPISGRNTINSITQEKFEQGEEVVRLNKKHIFKIGPLKDWFKTKKPPTNPLTREPVTVDDIEIFKIDVQSGGRRRSRTRRAKNRV
jgi:ankyrin repeat protein